MEEFENLSRKSGIKIAHANGDSESKLNDLSLAEEGSLPCSLCFLDGQLAILYSYGSGIHELLIITPICDWIGFDDINIQQLIVTYIHMTFSDGRQVYDHAAW